MGGVSLNTISMRPLSLNQKPEVEQGQQANLQQLEHAATQEAQRTQDSDHYFLEQNNIQASFEYDKQLKQVIITVRREDTGEIIQQIPSEHIVHMMQGIVETLDKMVDLKG